MTREAGLYAAPSIERTTFCGPTAIAATTGIALERVEDAVLKFRKQAAARGRTTRRERNMRGARVKTMYSYEIAPVCRALGFEATRIETKAATFNQLTAKMFLAEIKGPIIVLVTGHYIAMARWQFVDNNHRAPTPHTLYRSQRDRVKAVWTVTPARDLTRPAICD